jgi:hypothetical protein
MNEHLEQLKLELIRLVKAIDNIEWVSAEIIFEFAPFINKGYKFLPGFWDKNYNRVSLYLPYDEEFNKHFYNFIFLFNQEKKYNQISFYARRDFYDEARIEIAFNQTIEDTFQNNLPKSKKGKTLPWWKIESETAGLGNN